VIASVLDDLDVIFDGNATKFCKQSVVHDRSTEPYIGTTYTRKIHNLPNPVVTFQQPVDQKVYFAGETIHADYFDWGPTWGCSFWKEGCQADIARINL
jgi:hypothetical protein